MATLDQAIQQMLGAGMPEFPDGGPRVNTSGVVRYGPKKNAWYRLFEFASRNGRRYISGAYGYWGRLDKQKIETDWEGVDPAEFERLKQAQAQLEERERVKREERAKFAANRARKQFFAATWEGESPYLKRKGVDPEKGLRFSMPEGLLLVPMLRYDQVQGNGRPKLVGLQKIDAEGKKRFNAGMAKQGAAMRLGNVKDGEPVLIAEGLATALSIRKAIDRRYAVYVAFDCGNLLPVARIVRGMHPESAVLFCADDDRATGEPGRRHADLAAAAIGKAYVALPQFVDPDAALAQKWTDFNDLHAAEGLAVLKKQIDAALTAAGAAREKKRGKEKSPQGPRRIVNWSDLFNRYTLIYSTDTLWDAEIGRIVKLSTVKIAHNKDVVEYWLDSPDRRMVNPDQVVFDPTETCGPECVNLFRGMPPVPAQSDAVCDKLLGLLYYMCGDDDKVFDWVLKWVAYPLQFPGAKMQTAVVMHGKEGVGKNIFWNAVAEIYGEYGSLITQAELESPYNSWISQRLFMIANEVISRQELRHHVGKLKNLVTEPKLPISEKYLPLRYEANHMQMVFLTNELQALQISPDDRRFMVIKTPEKREPEYYKEIVAELRAGGAAALHRYLLDYQLDDFAAHTLPIMTAAKEDLIELGLSSTQYFWRQIHDGCIELPYGPCFTQDMYRAYTIFCPRMGERNPAKLPQFSQAFMSMNGVSRDVKRVIDPDRPESVPRSQLRQRPVFMMGDRPQGQKEEQDWLDNGVAAFRAALKAFARDDPLRRPQDNQTSGRGNDGPAY